MANGKVIKSKKLVIYLHDKSHPSKEEGTVHLCDDRGKLQKDNEYHFDKLSDIGDRVRSLLNDNGISWP